MSLSVTYHKQPKANGQPFIKYFNIVPWASVYPNITFADEQPNSNTTLSIFIFERSES